MAGRISHFRVSSSSPNFKNLGISSLGKVFIRTIPGECEFKSIPFIVSPVSVLAKIYQKIECEYFWGKFRLDACFYDFKTFITFRKVTITLCEPLHIFISTEEFLFPKLLQRPRGSYSNLWKFGTFLILV